MDAIIWCFFDLQFVSISFNEIVDVVEIEFDKAYSDCKLFQMHSLPDVVENMMDWTMEVAFALIGTLTSLTAEDCVGFACSCLAIGQECGIVAFENRVYQMFTFLINLLLCLLQEDVIESEDFLFVILPLNCDCCVIVHL